MGVSQDFHGGHKDRHAPLGIRLEQSSIGDDRSELPEQLLAVLQETALDFYPPPIDILTKAAEDSR